MPSKSNRSFYRGSSEVWTSWDPRIGFFFFFQTTVAWHGLANVMVLVSFVWYIKSRRFEWRSKLEKTPKQSFLDHRIQPRWGGSSQGREDPRVLSSSLHCYFLASADECNLFLSIACHVQVGLGFCGCPPFYIQVGFNRKRCLQTRGSYWTSSSLVSSITRYWSRNSGPSRRITSPPPSNQTTSFSN